MREIVVAQPDPSAPIFGNPQLPNTSSQLATTFTRFAETSTTVTGFTTSIDCRYRRNAKYASSAGALQFSAHKYGPVAARTPGSIPKTTSSGGNAKMIAITIGTSTSASHTPLTSD